MRRALAVLALTTLAACNGGAGSQPDDEPDAARGAAVIPQASPPAPAVSAAATSPLKVVAAGDIACGNCADGQTARLAASLNPKLVLALGDTQYETGAYRAYLSDYDASWGRLKSLTRPVVGNHEYTDGTASGYYKYFGARAGDPSRGYYSFNQGGWHFVALNSNCGAVPCGKDSRQVRWLKSDLAASTARCTIAYWHAPRFSSGLHRGTRTVQPFWRALVADRAELVLAGHDHDYERFAPLDASGQPSSSGVRSIVVGTGGRALYAFTGAATGSQVRNNRHFGVLELTLGSSSYSWRFVAVGGQILDKGSGTCR
jgi:hypothetical protein